MAYRRFWYTFGVRDNAGISVLTANDVFHGDTVFNTTLRKPMVCYDTSKNILITSFTAKIWLTEDMFIAWDTPNTSAVGNVVRLVLPAAEETWTPGAAGCLLRLATDTAYRQYCGVVVNFALNNSLARGIASQGYYDVKFTDATTTVTAGNLALLSSTPGRATQGLSTGGQGVVGVIAETKTLGADKLAKVFIQSYSSV